MTAETWDVIRAILRIAVAVVFIAMGISHFVPKTAQTMAAMVPPPLRWRGALRPAVLVAFTGLCEIAGGVGLLVPPLRLAAGICLVVFLAAVFPANAYAARHRDRFGAIAVPFVPRLIAQLVLAALVLWVATG